MKNSLLRLPKRKAEFIEPMECAPVTKLLDAPGWVYEILCGHIKFLLWRSALCGAAVSARR
jgi:hypothetical protein